MVPRQAEETIRLEDPRWRAPLTLEARVASIGGEEDEDGGGGGEDERLSALHIRKEDDRESRRIMRSDVVSR